MGWFKLAPAEMVAREERPDIQNSFIKPAAQVSAEAARANRTPGFLKMLAANYLGNEFLDKVFDLSVVHQSANTELTEEERNLAEKLAIGRVDLNKVNIGNEIGAYLEEEITRIGARMVGSFKRRNYQEIINSQQNTNIINIGRSDFYALAAYLTGVGKNALNFDLFTPMFNKDGVTLRVDANGSVILDWGMESRLVAQNLRDLTIDVEIPDNIEAANAVISGNFSFTWFQGLTRLVAGTTKKGKSMVIDTGCLNISLAGKNERIVLPVPSVNRGMRSIKKFIRTLGAVQRDIERPEMEEENYQKLPWSMLSDSDLREAIEEETEKVARNIPRFTRIIEEAKRLREEKNNITINRWNLTKKIGSHDSERSLDWFNTTFSSVVEEIGALLKENPKAIIERENEAMAVLTKSGVPKNDVNRGYRIVRYLAESIVRNQQKIRWLKTNYDIDVNMLVNSNNLELWKPLFTSDNNSGEKEMIIGQINEYLLKRGVSIFETDEVREVIVGYARMFFN